MNWSIKKVRSRCGTRQNEYQMESGIAKRLGCDNGRGRYVVYAASVYRVAACRPKQLGCGSAIAGSCAKLLRRRN